MNNDVDNNSHNTESNNDRFRRIGNNVPGLWFGLVQEVQVRVRVNKKNCREKVGSYALFDKIFLPKKDSNSKKKGLK